MTVAIGILGVVLFAALGLPLPFLLGPIFACLLFALAGARMAGMGRVGTGFRTILGVAAGASISPEHLSRASDMLASLALIPVFVAIIALTSYPLMRRVFGFDQHTSYYSAMPGGLQDLLVYGEEAGADVRTLSLIHATRVLMIVTIAPIALSLFWNVDLSAPPGQPASAIPLHELGLMAVAALGGWWIANRLGIFGASIIGPMIVAAAFSLTGLIHNRPPAEVIWAAQFFIGIGVGAKYAGITLADLRHSVLAGLANALLLTAISAVFIIGVVKAGIAPGMDAFLAFLPGGQGEMVVLSIIAGADLTYVVLHHISRLVLVVICAPVVMRLLERN